MLDGTTYCYLRIDSLLEGTTISFVSQNPTESAKKAFFVVSQHNTLTRNYITNLYYLIYFQNTLAFSLFETENIIMSSAVKDIIFSIMIQRDKCILKNCKKKVYVKLFYNSSIFMIWSQLPTSLINYRKTWIYLLNMKHVL